jgi:predicted alpha/beta hydrolase family esterase
LQFIYAGDLVMKKLIIFCCLLTACLTHAEVIFVPGWLTEKNSPENYSLSLQQIYQGENVTVMQWSSNTTWDSAVATADAFTGQLAQHIISKVPAEREKIILIGHSLGGRIIVKTAEILAANNIKIKQFVILGGALDLDYDLTPVVRASLQTNISVFSRNDTILKYLYANKYKKMAIGFAGIKNMPSERFQQYSFTTPEPAVTVYNSQFWLDAFNHFAVAYISTLSEIVAGKKHPYVCMYDYSKITLPRSRWAIPGNWHIPPLVSMKVEDSYADWHFLSTQIKIPYINWRGEVKYRYPNLYIIVDHYGRIFSWNIYNYRLMRIRFNELKQQIVKIH